MVLQSIGKRGKNMGWRNGDFNGDGQADFVDYSLFIDEIDRIQYSANETDDVIGRVYEYFLRKFCIAAKSEKGEFYTPGNIVELM